MARIGVKYIFSLIVIIVISAGMMTYYFQTQDSVEILLHWVKNIPTISPKAVTVGLRAVVHSPNHSISRPILTRTLYPITDGPYLINNPDICAGYEPLHFFIPIVSAINHFERRRIIRLTYANEHSYNHIRFKHAFYLGTSLSNETRVLIQNESKRYADIIQGDFEDTYHNLTHKTALVIRWINNYCTHAQLILKADDDVFLNVIGIYLNILPFHKPQDKSILCYLRKPGTSPIQREKRYKWELDIRYFRNMTYFPVAHCNGGMMILSTGLVPVLLRVMSFTPFLWIDDVYIGLVASKIKGVRYVDILQYGSERLTEIKRCFYSTIRCDILYAFMGADGLTEDFWLTFKRNLTPDNAKFIRKSRFVSFVR